MTRKPILLATDLSCRCDRALDRATSLAAAWKAPLVVLHVLQEPGQNKDLPSWRHLGVHQAAVDRVRRDLRETEGVQVEVIVESGEPSSVIAEVSRRLGCEIIVTGVARDETLGRMFLGTTVTALTHHAGMPVLVVKSRSVREYQNVIVASDFSDGSRHALEAAATLLPGANVRLFHCISTIFDGLADDERTGLEAATHQAMIEAREFLAATPALADSGRTVQAACKHGEIAEMLQKEVESQDCDLVVVGTKGRSGLAGLLLGSVAQHLLSNLSVDVLVVNQRKAGGAA